MKKCFVAAVIATFGIVNAQEHAAPAHAEPAHVTAPAPVAVPAPEAHAVTAEPVEPAITAEQIATVQANVEQILAPQATDTNAVTLVLQEQPKKKKRTTRVPKNDFAVVDVPANFEIQARKVMPVDAKNWGTDNLDTWWGRANLMVLTESENFIGKLHLRMYPGDFDDKRTRMNTQKGEGDTYEKIDLFQLYEAWAWHRGDYVNVKIGRWDNTARFGSKTFGGYVDAKKDKYTPSAKDIAELNVRYPTWQINNIISSRNKSSRQAGFMSTYYPENMVQFGLHNFSENMSLDVALISSDEHLNRGDLRTYFHFKDLAGFENMEFAIGYRSNVFDEIYDKTSDVTHTVSLSFRMPVVKDVGILKNLTLFAESAFIGLDDQEGTVRADGGSVPSANNPAFPVLGGLDIALYRGLDKVVIEAEYDGNRRNLLDRSENNVRDIQGSIYVQKILNERFTLNLGVQSEHNTKDFSFAARLQGRIN